MNKFLKLNAPQRLTILNKVAEKAKLPVAAVEKDMWVTMLLHTVFSLPVADKLIFKGGTSLSKAWHLIDRFSEDIDLAVDPKIFGIDGDPTKKQIKKLRKASSLFVREELCSMIKAKLKETGLSELLTIEAQPDGEGDSTYPEPRQLYIHYKSLVSDTTRYLRPDIILEVSARSLIEPSKTTHIKSILQEHISAESLNDTPVITALPEKTFLEKIFLLHEMFSLEGHGNKAERKSRHLYDLSQMMDKDFAQKAVTDIELWETIRHHREIYTSITGFDYKSDIRNHLVLVPREDIHSVWKKDYETMCESMIYGDKPSWSELLDRMQDLQHRFHKENVNALH